MRSQTDRSRTYWTTTMERYFIDLMIEQIQRGNRTGHTFNKQAWTDMLTLFNAKFCSQYDKDVIKSRYTNMWKQFNEVKNLLSQSDFSWDESRQIVIADDCVWDAYIKVHPDARPYKTKAVLNFNDLCLIFGYTNADGRYSLSSHDLDFDNEVQPENMSDGIVSLAPSNNERSRTDWTPAMDQYFIELMLDQIGRGNKNDNTFNKQAWTDMLALFNAKFGPQHGKRVLRHRHKKLLKYYSDMTNLLKQNEFSWDERQQMIIANDGAWDAYIKAHPQARTYRMKILPNYNDLGLIYGSAADDVIQGQSQSHQDKDHLNDVSGIKAGEEKGSHTSSGTDRTRTYWTPPMDRYLIDLLLEQVHRGNKLGQTFISQAWIDMVASFNVNFRSYYDKDVLKNRYKHLRRQYNDVKILLEHSGFVWDETREMVTAEDCVWETYIKAHPEARPYRVKTVPSYPKLCEIFGEESFDGRYNRLAHSADPMCELPVLMTGQEQDDHYSTCIDPLDLDWTPEMDHYLIELVLQQEFEGNKIDHSFNDLAWTSLIGLFNEKFGLQCDRYVLEHRYICLMKQYDDINNILNHGGFAWDEPKQMVTADNDVWEAYIKEHPAAINYRDKFLASYNGLCKIYGNRGLNESLKHQDLGTVAGALTDHEIQTVELDGISGYLQLPAVDLKSYDQKRKLETIIPADFGCSAKMQKTSKEMHEALSDMAGVVTKLVEKKEDKSNIPIESAIDALQSIPDIDDELLLDACDLLEDERKAKTFLALDVSLRKKWLLRKLRP